jgi:hypothetical protein
LGLDPLPETFPTTREALHLVADRIVAASRKPDNEIALTRTPGGFGTPPFEFDGRSLQVRVDGAHLVVDEDGDERRAPLTSLAAAAEFVGPELLPRGVPEDATGLGIDPEAARVLADLYAFAARALAGLRDSLPAAAAASPIVLWPEHFDIALEAGDEEAGRRATYGFSPGDERHPLPYAYVSVWSAKPEGELWNATGFVGAEVGYPELVADADPEAATVGFFTARYEALVAHG